MAQPILTFITTFDRNTGKIVVADTTNYLSYGINLATLGNFVNGRLRITYTTSGGVSVLYDNLSGITPDIELVGGVLVWNGDINIPLTTLGVPLPAEYTVEYVVECGYDNNGDDFVVNTSNTYTYNIVDPSICIETSVDCATSTATSVDTTVYEIQNATVDYIVRSHTQFPPPASGYAVNGPFNLITVTYTPIVTTTWTAEVISTVNYLLTSGLYVVVNLSGVKEFQVICDTNLSKILCCLTDLQKQYEALECTNPVKAANFKTNRLDPTLQHLVLFLAAQTAGNQTKMAQQYAAIVEVSGCSESCNCNGSTPTAVSPSQGGPAASFLVNSPLGTIQVTTITAGNLTTFSLELSSALQAAIASISNSVVTTGTPTFLDLTSTTVGNTTTYNIDYLPPANPIGFSVCSKRIFIDLTSPGTFPAAYLPIAWTQLGATGTGINVLGFHGIVLGTSFPNASTDYAVITLNGILAFPTNPYTVTAQIMSRYNVVSNTVAYDIACEVLFCDFTNGNITLRLVNPVTGQPLKLADLITANAFNAIREVYITLTINSQ
jgi:hypothetical protein